MPQPLGPTATPGEGGPPLRIAVKFRTRVPASPLELPGLQAFLKEVGFKGTLRVLPLVESLSPERLAALVERARHNDPSYDPPDFSLWKQIVSPPGAETSTSGPAFE